MSALGTSRPFAVMQQSGRFRGEADMPRTRAVARSDKTDPNPVIMSTSARDPSWTLRRHAYRLQSSEGPTHNYGPPGKKGTYAMSAETIRPILAIEGQGL